MNPDRVSRESKATLVITGVTTADNGIYKCSLNLQGSNPIGHQVRLAVTVRPTFLPSHPNNTYQIIEGQDLKINCTAIGPPAPNITWVNITDGNDDTKSQGSGSAVVQIKNIKRYHAGVYECQAKNNQNDNATTTRTSVTVYYKPAVSRLITNTKHSWNGKMTTLKCIVNGFPTPHVTWYRPNGQQISCGIKNLTKGSQVTVRTTECGADYGLYRCQVVNVAGRDAPSIRVTRLFPPGASKFTILDQDIQASSVNVRWIKPGYDGGSAVIDYKVQINTSPSQEQTTTNTQCYFFRLTKNTSYKIIVVAINVVGSGNLSQVTITTKNQGKPEIPELLVVLYTSKDSKLSVVLRWSKPADNGGTIDKYTIYRKEVRSQSQWKKNADVNNPSQLQYTAANNIVYGKTYMFMVTAWNEYGESVKDESSAKTVNTTTDRAVIAIGTRTDSYKIPKSKHDTVVGVITSLLILSLGLNVVLVVLLCRRVKKNGRDDQRKETRTSAQEQSDEVAQRVPEYEAVQPAIGNASVPGTPFPSSGDASQYQELNLLASMSQTEGQGPTYEPLQAKSKKVEPSTQPTQHFAHDQHPYESLDLKNKKSDYHSLQTTNI